MRRRRVRITLPIEGGSEVSAGLAPLGRNRARQMAIDERVPHAPRERLGRSVGHIPSTRGMESSERLADAWNGVALWR